MTLQTNINIKAITGSEIRLTDSKELEGAAPYSLLYPYSTWIRWAIAWCEDHNRSCRYSKEKHWFIATHMKDRGGEWIAYGFIARRALAHERQKEGDDSAV